MSSSFAWNSAYQNVPADNEGTTILLRDENIRYSNNTHKITNHKNIDICKDNAKQGPIERAGHPFCKRRKENMTPVERKFRYSTLKNVTVQP